MDEAWLNGNAFTGGRISLSSGLASKKYIDPLKVEKKSEEEIKTVHDLGFAAVQNVYFVPWGDTYDLKVEIAVVTHGSLSRLSSLSVENPGLYDEVKAHEEGHYDQIIEVLYD
ncbi:hypothetical protein RQM59_10110 [Flavobacteriaceae bacterium S356]|uniref:Uncharacterized protein n=1 Tax=Asprobacillus argus TaxID=3076534 RepID=A0ABU3LHY0_9FLAO|nr:hypothetical protein [Flavobacteriaceae bacterium S356]